MARDLAPVLAQGPAALMYQPPTSARSVAELLDTYAPIEAPSAMESAARGVAQGVTLGFADEITGGLESAFTDKTYQQAREESRGAYHSAQQANPLAYGAGEVGGGLASLLVPGLGAAKAGASVGMLAAKGALAGGAYGLGASEADLTKGEVGAAALDTAKGAFVGGTLAGVLGFTGHAIKKGAGRAASAAAKRVAREGAEEAGEVAGKVAAKEMGEAAVPTVAKKATEEAGEVGEAILRRDKQNLMREITGDIPGSARADATVSKRFSKVVNLAAEHVPGDAELMTSLKSPAKALDVLDARLATHGENLRPAYAEFDKVAGSTMKPRGLVAAIDEVISSEQAKLGDFSEKRALKAFRKDVANSLMERRKTGKLGLSTQDLRDLTTSALKDENRAMGSLNETTKFKLQQRIHEVTQDILDKHLDDTAAKIDAAGGGDWGKNLIANIRAENKKMRLYMQMKEVMQNRLGKEEVGRRGLVEVLQQGGITGLATRAGVEVAARGERAATRALAKLVRARRAGGPVPPSVVREALSEGVPDKTIHAILNAPAEAGVSP